MCAEFEETLVRKSAGRFKSSFAARSVAICMVLVVALLAGGCGFRTLKKDLQRTAGQTVLEGHARVSSIDGGPIVIVVYSVTTKQIADFFLFPRPGPFFFVLPAGEYQLAAFEDRNRNLSYEPGEEPTVLANDLVLRAGERRVGLYLVIDPGSSVRIPFEVKAFSPGGREVNQLPAWQLGTIANIDDPRFSEENGKLGLWEPLRFLFDVGAGVYFMEEYDPHKIPILFVHGAAGTPRDWKHLVGSLDGTRFQPWLVYYPTAPHLDKLGRGLVRALAALQVKYGFSRLILVAQGLCL